MASPKTCLCLSWPRKRSQKPKQLTQTTPSPYDSQDSITITEKEGISKSQPKEREMNPVAEAICGKVVETHRQLLELGNYEPGAKVNKLLGELVPLCTQTLDQDIIQQIVYNPNIQEVLPSLRDICSKSESCFESYYVGKIIGDGMDGPEQALERVKGFLYYSNYLDLTWLELCAVRAARRSSPKKVAFIGSGPLPLTSLCLLQELKKDLQPGSRADEIEILNIDCDPSAIATSQRLCEAVGDWSKGMKFLCAVAGSPEVNLRDYDVVYLAALVGISQEEKEDITIKVASTMRPGSLLVIRSAIGIRTCLYLEFDIATEKLLEKLEPCLTMHPHGEVVNSVIVAKVKEPTENNSYHPVKR